MVSLAPFLRREQFFGNKICSKLSLETIRSLNRLKEKFNYPLPRGDVLTYGGEELSNIIKIIKKRNKEVEELVKKEYEKNKDDLGRKEAIYAELIRECWVISRWIKRVNNKRISNFRELINSFKFSIEDFNPSNERDWKNRTPYLVYILAKKLELPPKKKKYVEVMEGVAEFFEEEPYWK